MNPTVQLLRQLITLLERYMLASKNSNDADYYLIFEAMKAVIALEKNDHRCKWTKDDDTGYYMLSCCDDLIDLCEGTPDECKYIFCPVCGRAIEEVVMCNKCGTECTELCDPEKTEQESCCSWTQDCNGNYETSCGEMHCFIEGNPEENNHRFCPYCGKRLKA
jgi:hypothetical protein